MHSTWIRTLSQHGLPWYVNGYYVTSYAPTYLTCGTRARNNTFDQASLVERRSRRLAASVPSSSKTCSINSPQDFRTINLHDTPLIYNGIRSQASPQRSTKFSAGISNLYDTPLIRNIVTQFVPRLLPIIMHRRRRTYTHTRSAIGGAHTIMVHGNADRLLQYFFNVTSKRFQLWISQTSHQRIPSEWLLPFSTNPPHQNGFVDPFCIRHHQWPFQCLKQLFHCRPLAEMFQMSGSLCRSVEEC